MNIPMQIEFRHMEASEALSKAITEKAEKLLKITDRVTQCHVTVEAPHRHHHKGQQYQVGIQVAVPGKTLSVGQHGESPAHEDAYVAVRDAFKAMHRQLQTYTDKTQGNVKTHNRATETVWNESS